MQGENKAGTDVSTVDRERLFALLTEIALLPAHEALELSRAEHEAIRAIKGGGRLAEIRAAGGVEELGLGMLCLRLLRAQNVPRYAA